MQIRPGKTYTAKQMKKKLDEVFSLYIRKRDNGICFTCKVQRPIKQMQNGHYISRTHTSVRFDEQNCHCQCVGCNVFLKGNIPKYSLELVRKYGPGVLEELERRRAQVRKINVGEYLELIKTYEAKIYELDHS